jgi:REP element-mobilizing transposase RayT
MPDHAHVLIGIERATLLAFVREWKSRCYLIRCRRGSREPFWQRSFWDHALRNAERLPEAALYILTNPVRAGLVDDWRRYPLSGSAEWLR